LDQARYPSDENHRPPHRKTLILFRLGVPPHRGSSLNERKIDYLLIGGCALYAHGYARATVDIDLDGIPVSTVNLEGLLLTKKTVRDKDKADRIVIEKALRKKGA
jgi:hypothetical protein